MSPFPDTEAGFVPLLSQQARATPARPFARLGDRVLSFGALEAASAQLASWLAARGVGQGDRVALMLRNGEAALSLMLAIARMGSVWVPINPAALGEPLAYVLGHAEPRLVIAEADLLPAIVGCGAGRNAPLIAADRLAAEVASVAEPRRQPSAALAPPPPDSPFAIMYTSGTTGRPKGVIVSHRMLRLAGEAAALVAAARDGDVLYLWEPLFHIGGAQMIVLPLIRAVTLALAANFSARRFWPDVRAAGATHIHFLGGILQILLKQPAAALDRAHGVRIAWGGGCPSEVWTAFESRFGVKIRECYGMTECASITTANLAGPVGSVGTPVPWFEVAVVDPSGQPVAAGERGEILVRERLAGALTRGYFKDADSTARSFRAGAFLTGDLGSCDTAGNFYFHGRLTESVRVRGENVAAAEVEGVVRQHAAVEDCAVIGVAADVGEAEIKVFVVLRPGARLSAPELSEWLAGRLARHQRPRYIAFLAAFQRTPSARIMKHTLSQRTDDCWDVGRQGG